MQAFVKKPAFLLAQIQNMSSSSLTDTWSLYDSTDYQTQPNFWEMDNLKEQVLQNLRQFLNPLPSSSFQTHLLILKGEG